MFNQEVMSLIDIHDNDYLTKDDLEDISRQIFYCLYEFKDLIVEYLKKNDR